MKPAFLVLFFSLSLGAQNATEIDVSAEPHHRLVLGNPQIKVYSVDVPPGQATLMHRHAHDYVYVSLGASQISNDIQGKPPAAVKLQDGETRFVPGGFNHQVRDLAATPFRNVTIEFLQDEKARTSPPPHWDEERGLQVLEGGTRDIMFVKDGVRVSQIDLNPGAFIPRHRHAGAHLVVAVSELSLRSQIAGKPPANVTLKAGEVKWVPGGFTHTVTNTGKSPARFITLEFPQ